MDTGVSGDIADKMGDIMQDLGTKMQVITITHLPQIPPNGYLLEGAYMQAGDKSEQIKGLYAVSYTHLDVYKRQV